MRIANLEDRLVIVQGGRYLDVAEASGGQFSSDPQAIYERWAEFVGWVQEARPSPMSSLILRAFAHRCLGRGRSSPSG